MVMRLQHCLTGLRPYLPLEKDKTPQEIIKNLPIKMINCNKHDNASESLFYTFYTTEEAASD